MSSRLAQYFQALYCLVIRCFQALYRLVTQCFRALRRLATHDGSLVLTNNPRLDILAISATIKCLDISIALYRPAVQTSFNQPISCHLHTPVNFRMSETFLASWSLVMADVLKL